MDFHPDADRRALIGQAFSRPLDTLLPLARLHRADTTEPWAALADLGVFGIAADPAIGGAGLGPAEEVLLAMDLGRRLASPQLLSTLMAVHCAGDDTAAAIARGACRVAPAVISGGRICVIDGDDADRLLLRHAGAATLVACAGGIDRDPLDADHWTASLTIAGRASSGLAWVDGAAILRVRLIEAAALCGIAACASDMAAAYAGLRRQFGHPIGGFQAVKHHCANMAMAAMAASDATSFAAMAVEQGRHGARLQVESALLLAIDAALANSRRNIQVHGGIGFSAEADPHLLLKRAHLLIEACGGADRAMERVANAEAPMIREG